MYRMCMVCLLMALFATAGCNKAESKKAPVVGAANKSATITSNAAQPLATSESKQDPVVGKSDESAQNPDAGKQGEDLAGVVTIESWKEQQDKDFPPLAEENVEFIRAELIRLVPENNFSYDEAANVLLGEGLPEDGLDFEILVDKVEMEGRMNPGKLSHDVLSKWCSGILQELKPKEMSPARAETPGTQKREGSGGGASKSSEKETGDEEESTKIELVFAASAIGEWKSIREDHPRITTYHNEDYFEFFSFMEDGEASLRYYRDGKMVLLKEYTYNYSPRNGEISLYGNAKKLATTLILKMVPGNEEELFIEFPDKDSITVYEKVGIGRLAKQSDWSGPGGDLSQ